MHGIGKHINIDLTYLSIKANGLTRDVSKSLAINSETQHLRKYFDQSLVVEYYLRSGFWKDSSALAIFETLESKFLSIESTLSVKFTTVRYIAALDKTFLALGKS
jgi:hypothetical protein